jgi:hypothetical protein
VRAKAWRETALRRRHRPCPTATFDLKVDRNDPVAAGTAAFADAAIEELTC